MATRHDYQPFGTELGAGVGGRTTGMGFSNSGDTNRKKFTQYERDTETGLDYAQARYYSSSQGRFTTVDPLMASARSSAPQTWNRYCYGLNNPLKYIDPSGLNADDIGTAEDQRRQQAEQQRQQQQTTPPPPGGPVTPGPIKIDIGPVPLPEGEVAWPTSLEVVQNPNKTYNGESVVSPSGEVIDERPNYGVGRTVDYIIRDQVGNPMSTGVLLRETVTPTNQQARDLMGDVDVNRNPVRPDARGIVPDTLGAISTDARVITFLNQNQVNATFSQTITVYGTVGSEYRTALTLKNEYRLTNSGVTITTGTVEQRARPK